MERFYRTVFPDFDRERFYLYLSNFGIESRRRISTFSKGTKKQLAILLGICSGAKYLCCDETFDGLDPVMRQVIKSLFAKEMEERDFTPVIASHNLRELEDICDHVGLLHQGGYEVQHPESSDRFFLSGKGKGTVKSAGYCERGEKRNPADSYSQRDERGDGRKIPAVGSSVLRGAAIVIGGNLYQRDGGERL